jgi:hypothetical protein
MNVLPADRAVPQRWVVRGLEGVPALRAAIRELDAVLHLRPIQLPPPVVADNFAQLDQSRLEPAAASVSRRQAVEFALRPKVLGSVNRPRVTALLQPIGVDQPHGGIPRVG